jgi:uncharacterized cupredoxin-like copper-binding protein
MRFSRRALLATIAGLWLVAVGPAPVVVAATVVDVTLWDKLDTMPLGTGMGMGMGMGMHDPSMAAVGIDVTPDTVKAGEVTFRAVNTSKSMIHEMIVVPVADVNTPLPYNESEQRVDEDAAGSLGEVSELDPGKSGTLTLTLKPGTYILFCNVEGHYMAGMWTLLTVEP